MEIINLEGDMYPSEFMADGDIYRIFSQNGLPLGRLISGSKTGYRERYPDNLVIFNANIVTKKRGKIWHGDLDVDRDLESLEDISKILGEKLYILREMDARFGSENAGIKTLISRAVKTIDGS